MPYHHRTERKKFEARQQTLRLVYQQAGMAESEIHALYHLDLQEFLGERRYREHTQPFAEECCAAHCADCTAWIDFSVLLPQKDLDILVLYAIGGYNQAEIAACIGISQQSISRKIARLKKYLKNFE